MNLSNFIGPIYNRERQWNEKAIIKETPQPVGFNPFENDIRQLQQATTPGDNDETTTTPPPDDDFGDFARSRMQQWKRKTQAQ